MQTYFETTNSEEDSWQEVLKETDLDDLDDFQIENAFWVAWD